MMYLLIAQRLKVSKTAVGYEVLEKVRDGSLEKEYLHWQAALALIQLKK